MFTTDLTRLDAIPQETIVMRPLAPIKATGCLQRQGAVIAQNILTYLDNRSATRLLTSCRHFVKLSSAHLLYAPLLKRYFPASYPSLTSRVSKQPAVQQGLLWYRLYAMIHGPDPKPQVLSGHTYCVTCITQLADGRIASGSYDHTVRIWPLDGSPPSVLKGHKHPVTCLTQLTDGRIASGSVNGTVRIWPLDGSPPSVLKGHTSTVGCLTQLADGRIASGSRDETVRIWGKDTASSFNALYIQKQSLLGLRGGVLIFKQHVVWLFWLKR